MFLKILMKGYSALSTQQRVTKGLEKIILRIKHSTNTDPKKVNTISHSYRLRILVNANIKKNIRAYA
jgi:hypothetical protein